jgi:hypothetical protein
MVGGDGIEPRNISIVRATSLLDGCAVAGCSMIVAWFQTRSSTGAASSGSSPWKVANWQTRPQQIAFAVISTGGSSWSIAVTFEDPSGVYPSPISSAPTGFTILAGSSNQTSRWDRACSSHCSLASDDGGAVMMSALPPQNRHRQRDRQCPEVPTGDIIRSRRRHGRAVVAVRRDRAPSQS